MVSPQRWVPLAPSPPASSGLCCVQHLAGHTSLPRLVVPSPGKTSLHCKQISFTQINKYFWAQTKEKKKSETSPFPAVAVLAVATQTALFLAAAACQLPARCSVSSSCWFKLVGRVRQVAPQPRQRGRQLLALSPGTSSCCLVAQVFFHHTQKPRGHPISTLQPPAPEWEGEG